MSTKTENILLTLAYLLFADKHHLHRLHFVGESLDTVEDWITGARDDELIEELRWSLTEERKRATTGERRKQTIRQPSMWQLTPEGHEQIKHYAAYPYKVYRKRATALLEHDRRVLHMIVRLIELARETGLCGIKVFREVKLNPNPKSRRPVLDALVVMEVGGSFSREHPCLVPWSLDAPLDDETLWRIAIEGDNATEPGQVVAGKAGAYQKVLANEHWQRYWVERYGPVRPIVAWGAPTEARALAIVRWCEDQWTDGQWLVTSGAGLRENRWWYHNGGRTRAEFRVGFPSCERGWRAAQREEDARWAVVLPHDVQYYRHELGMTYAQYEQEQRRETEERQKEVARQHAERQAEERRRLALAERARAEAARQAHEATDRQQREAEERAEAQRQEAEARRRAFRRRLVRPWWWAYWAGCGLWWVTRHVLIGIAWVAGWWWSLLWSDEHAYGLAQPFARALTAAALVGSLWIAGISPWQPVTWLWEVVDGPGALVTTQAGSSGELAGGTEAGCGRFRTTVDLPLRAEPRLSAPMVLPAKLPKGAVVVSLCTTETSVERLAAGDTTITWLRLQAEGEEGWANQAYLEDEL
jgi:hypothetical protein